MEQRRDTEPGQSAGQAAGKGEGSGIPFVPPEQAPPEFTFPAVLVGMVLGILFGASSLYLVLKVGLTVSASVPIAVLSVTLFRA
ncbi:MAG: OPT/YSL family transporter, partial [Thermogemmata sp.]